MVGRNNLIALIILMTFTSIGCSKITRKEINRKGLTKEEKYEFLKGINYTRSGNYPESIRRYQKIYKNNKRDTRLLKELGKTYARASDFEKGIKFYERALEIKPNDKESIRNLTYLYLAKGDYKNSLRYIEKLKKVQMDLETKRLKSYLLSKNGEHKRAYKLFEDVFKSNDIYDLEYYKTYAETLNYLNKKEKLKKFLKDGIKKYNNDEDFVIFYSKGQKKYFKDSSVGARELKRYIVSYGGNKPLFEALAYLSGETYNQRRER